MDIYFENYRKSFFDTAVADILRAMDGRSLVGSFILTVCLIEYMAYISVDNDNVGRPEYESFVHDNLCTLNNYHPEWIRSLRNALAHTYGKSYKMKEGEEKRQKGELGPYETEKGKKGYRLTHLMPTLHLHETSEIIVLNLESFVTDVIWATWNIFNSLQSRSTEKRIIYKRLEELLVITVSGSAPISYEHRLYKGMHRALRGFDTDKPSQIELYKHIEEILIDK